MNNDDFYKNGVRLVSCEGNGLFIVTSKNGDVIGTYEIELKNNRNARGPIAILRVPVIDLITLDHDSYYALAGLDSVDLPLPLTVKCVEDEDREEEEE